jgi:hypothetical protein
MSTLISWIIFGINKGGRNLKYLVLKIDDINRYLDEKAKIELAAASTSIETLRMIEGKTINEYFVVNKDEPYADKVKALIDEHESEEK